MQVWPVMHSRLTKRGLKSITGEEVRVLVLAPLGDVHRSMPLTRKPATAQALRLQKKGATILDVYASLPSCCLARAV